MGFSEKQEELVKQSWEMMKEDIPALSLYFFEQVLEIAPSSKRLFSFLKDTDEIPQNNPKLKAHAVKVFKMTCESAIQLREKGEAVASDSTLKYLTSAHLHKGIAAPHFEVVKKGVLRTVEKGVGEKWSEEMKGAWAEAYDQLILEIAPAAKGLFSFLKDTDEIPQNNPKLKAHAVKTCESAIQLREKGEVVVNDSTLKYLGSVHLQKGVIGPHFEVVKEGLLRTVEKGVGEKWNEEMKGAWSEAYDQLAAAIQAEMNKEATEINKETAEKDAPEIHS
ncbi:hypothetical protein M8C21_016805 [Ambrosia artemisiifolia]|uniref:Globin domain-containing protein n=1 Tax=Ambrosia artemisiifolia TaxID=4212 RepID=A0AAD5D7R4_AMBAR|nr:hypothetical protein M8C21_016805 [Ambrosia artemisiifolia]